VQPSAGATTAGWLAAGCSALWLLAAAAECLLLLSARLLFWFTAATLEGLMPMHGLYDATDPDLSAFARRGGKLLMWHGWSDPDISPLNSVAYAQAVSIAWAPQPNSPAQTALEVARAFYAIIAKVVP
jgi:hypothetical protein